MKRLICLLAGHKWNGYPDWLLRKCTRCGAPLERITP